MNGMRLLLAGAGGGMELCWLYGWAVFCMNAILHRPFPPFEALLAFAAGAWITGISTGKGWRVGSVLILNCAVFIGVTLWTVHAVFFPYHPFIDPGWLRAIRVGFHGFLEWAGFVATLCWVAIFWVSGVAMARRPRTYYRFCARFDIGIAAFFCLFMLRLALAAKGNVLVREPVSEILVFPFFLFSLFAIVASRQGEARRSLLSGYKAVGTVMGFGAAVVVVVGGIVLSAVAGLSALARSAGGFLRGAADSTFPFFERFLVVFFSRGTVRPKPPAPASGGKLWDAVGSGGGGWWSEWVGTVLGYGLSGILALVGAAMVMVCLVMLARWLVSRTPDGRESGGPEFVSWLRSLKDLLKRLGRMVRSLARGWENAADAYAWLSQWALRTGCGRRADETPWEFGTRLRGLFPALAGQIHLIVHAYNQEVYGGAGPEREVVRSVHLACYSLRSPLHWPARLRMRLSHDRDRDGEERTVRPA